MNPETLPARRRRTALPPGDRHDALLDAAKAAFLDNGYEATRVSDIVARASVAQGTFYLYFESKTAAFLAVAERATAVGIARMSRSLKAPSINEMVRNLVRESFEDAAENRNLFRLINASPLRGAVHTQTEQLIGPLVQALAERIRQEQAAGTADPAIDAHTAALMILGALDWAVYGLVVYPDAAAIARAAKHTAVVIENAMGLSRAARPARPRAKTPAKAK